MKMTIKNTIKLSRLKKHKIEHIFPKQTTSLLKNLNLTILAWISHYPISL